MSLKVCNTHFLYDNDSRRKVDSFRTRVQLVYRVSGVHTSGCPNVLWVFEVQKF